jgi:hypothetical protein
MRSPLVAYACVVGTMRPHLAGAIVLDGVATRDWLSALGHHVDASGRLEWHPVVVAEIDRLVGEVNAGLPGAERIRSHGWWATPGGRPTPTC